METDNPVNEEVPVKSKRQPLTRTTVYLTPQDKAKVRKIAKKVNLLGTTAVVRWAINEVLK